MKRLTITSAGIALLSALAGACTGEIPSAAAPSEPELAKGGPAASAGYTALNVGALIPGAQSSQANGVNDAGDVVGSFSSGTTLYPFALVAGTAVTLGSGPGMAWGVSNGSPTYVVGSAAGTPARWSLANPTQVTQLALTGGAAKGVNTGGATVGNLGANAAMWLADGTHVPIATPVGYTRGEGRGINDAGLAILQFAVSPTETAVNRAYLRLASGTLIELPPVGSDVTSYANDVSEAAVNGVVYVAGSTASSDLVSRSVRWTVDATSGAVLATDVLPTTESHGLGVSDAGGIAGFIDISSFRFSSYLWRGTNILKLGPPKGGKDPRAWAMSGSGQYVAGQTYVGSVSQAVRWTITSP
jgi:hypothetical protein